MTLVVSQGGVNAMFANNQLDVLVCPSAGSPALEDLRAHSRELLLDPETYDGPEDIGPQFTAPWDYSGHPTLTVPCGLSEDGLPLVFQMVANRLDEALLCQLGHACERPPSYRHLVSRQLQSY